MIKSRFIIVVYRIFSYKSQFNCVLSGQPNQNQNIIPTSRCISKEMLEVIKETIWFSVICILCLLQFHRYLYISTNKLQNWARWLQTKGLCLWYNRLCSSDRCIPCNLTDIGIHNSIANILIAFSFWCRCPAYGIYARQSRNLCSQLSGDTIRFHVVTFIFTRTDHYQFDSN